MGHHPLWRDRKSGSASSPCEAQSHLGAGRIPLRKGWEYVNFSPLPENTEAPINQGGNQEPCSFGTSIPQSIPADASTPAPAPVSETETLAGATSPTAADAPNAGKAEPAQEKKANAFVEALKNPKDRTGEMDKDDIALNNRLAVLSYLGIFFVVPGFLVKKSQYCKFHANQGLLLFLAGVLLTVVQSAIRRPMLMMGFLKPVVGLLFSLLKICLLVFEITGMVQAGKGEAKEVPFIGSIKILK